MSIPNWYAGQVMTADALNARHPRLVIQENDQTVTSSTVFVKSEIRFTPEPNALYTYELFISYSADDAEDFKWEWDSDATTGVLLSSFTAAYAANATTGADDGAAIIFRRPGNTTDRIAGGSDVANFHSAYDRGTFTTSSVVSEHALYFTQRVSGATGTILRGGNQTRFVYTRIG
ncbi:hypothetical protein ABZ208_35325 [Streptomyces sp. NPDC006208]|uniref:hypothetical protein n=1 Tax=Streptomyces sp. NPDC006208 TaxID=3156734 RepID=UPI0033A419EF